MWVNTAILSQRTRQITQWYLCWRQWGLKNSGSQSQGRPGSCARVKSTVSESVFTDRKLSQQLCLSMFNICVYFLFVLFLVLCGWCSWDLPIYAAYFLSEWHVRHYCLRKFRYSSSLSHARLWSRENLYSQILPTVFFLGVKYTFLHENMSGVETITPLP